MWSSVAALALTLITYVFFVRTGWGQRIDELAREGRKRTEYWPRVASTKVLRVAALTIVPMSILFSCRAIVRAGQRRLGVGLLIGGALAIGLAELLKLAALSRPMLVRTEWGSTRQTFPSGHATLGAVAALAAVAAALVTRRHWHGLIAAALTVWAEFILASGWHRPSDVVGGLLLGFAAVALVIAVTAAPTAETNSPMAVRGPSVEAGPLGRRRFSRWSIVAGIAFAVAAVGFYAPLDPGPATVPMRPLLYLGAAAIVAGTSVGSVVLVRRLAGEVMDDRNAEGVLDDPPGDDTPRSDTPLGAVGNP